MRGAILHPLSADANSAFQGRIPTSATSGLFAPQRHQQQEPDEIANIIRSSSTAAQTALRIVSDGVLSRERPRRGLASGAMSSQGLLLIRPCLRHQAKNLLAAR